MVVKLEPLKKSSAFSLLSASEMEKVKKDPMIGPLFKHAKIIHKQGKKNVHVWVQGTTKFYKAHRREITFTAALALAILAGKYVYDHRRQAYLKKLQPESVKKWRIFKKTDSEFIYKRGNLVLGIIKVQVSEPGLMVEYWVISGKYNPKTKKYTITKVHEVILEKQRTKSLELLNNLLKIK